MPADLAGEVRAKLQKVLLFAFISISHGGCELKSKRSRSLAPLRLRATCKQPGQERRICTSRITPVSLFLKTFRPVLFFLLVLVFSFCRFFSPSVERVHPTAHLVTGIQRPLLLASSLQAVGRMQQNLADDQRTW